MIQVASKDRSINHSLNGITKYLYKLVCLIDSSSAEGSSDDDKNYTLTEKLQNWAVTHQAPHCTLSDLLTVLGQFYPDSQKDPRTLLQTKLTYNVSEICGGHYYHFGLVSGLQEKIKYSVEFLHDNFCMSRTSIEH